MNLITSPQSGLMTSPEQSLLQRFELRPLHSNDVGQAVRLLRPTLDHLYPRGALLFERRLDEVLCGRASSTVVCIKGFVVGIATEVPKGARRVKISTLWIHPHLRRKRLGFVLAGFLVQRWMYTTVDSVHITVATGRLAALHGLLGTFGFRAVALEKDRYGVGRDEAILLWTPAWAASLGLKPKNYGSLLTLAVR